MGLLTLPLRIKTTLWFIVSAWDAYFPLQGEPLNESLTPHPKRKALSLWLGRFLREERDRLTFFFHSPVDSSSSPHWGMGERAGVGFVARWDWGLSYDLLQKLSSLSSNPGVPDSWWPLNSGSPWLWQDRAVEEGILGRFPCCSYRSLKDFIYDTLWSDWGFRSFTLVTVWRMACGREAS